MAKTLACKDTGMDCPWVGRAETEDELLKLGGEHVVKVHGEEVTPELIELAKSVIRDE